MKEELKETGIQKGGKRAREPEGRLAGCQRSVVLHLCLRYDGFLPWLGAEEGGERGCNHNRVRPDEATQVTSWDRVLFCLKHHSVHSIKLAPGQPHSALLAQEGGTLEPQGQWGATVSYQVKPGGVCEKRMGMRYRWGVLWWMDCYLDAYTVSSLLLIKHLFHWFRNHLTTQPPVINIIELQYSKLLQHTYTYS